MSVGLVKNFFFDVKADFEVIANRTALNQNSLEERAQGLALRILGAFALVVMAASAIAAIPTFFAAPLAAIPMLVIGIIGVAIAHDVIVVGGNKRQMAENIDGLQGGFSRAIGGVYGLGQAMMNEANTGLPYLLQGTLVAAPIYRMCGGQLSNQV